MAISGKDKFSPSVPLHGTTFDVPDVIANHSLLGCVGEGSYGKVFLVRNDLTGVYRALKIVFRGAFRDARPYQREFEAICRFEPISRSHPGFVQILQVGKLDDAFYYIMEVADDAATGSKIDPASYRPRTLSLNRGQMLAIQHCIEIGSSLADCLAVLHDNNLIHRDIKPSNIIFVNGSPKLADIGLVTQIDEANSMVGTAGFMPPEGPVGPPSDLYSLGKVLYEIATGKDRCEFPELPDDITTESTLHLELNQILLRACDPRPSRRYPTARDMRRELDVLHAGHSIKRLRQVERRLRTIRTAFIGTALVAIVAFLVFLRVEAKREEAARERQRRAGSLLAEGTAEMRAGNLSRALPFFIQAAQLDPRDIRSHQLRIGSVLSMAPSAVLQWQSAVGAVFSDDGAWLVAPREDGIHLFESATGREIEMHALDGRARFARLSPDRARIVAVFDQHFVLIHRASGKRSSHEFNEPLVDATFVPHDQRLAIAFKSGKACFFEPETGKQSWFPGQSLVLSISFDRHGDRMVTSYGDLSQKGYSHFRDARTGAIIGRTLEDRFPYRGIFSPDGTLAVICGWRNATPYHVSSGELAGDSMDSDDAITHCAFSEDSKLLATASYDGSVRLWELPSCNPVRVNHVLEHRSRPEYVAFVGNETLVTRCIDGATYVWTLGAEKVNITTIPREPAANPLQITREDATLSAQGTRILGTVHNREIDLQFPTAVGALALSPGGDAFAAGSKDALFEITQARLYRLDALDKPFDLHHRDGINHVTFSHQGDKLVTCSEDFSAILWDAKTGTQIGKPMRHRWQVAWACFSSDDKWVATIGWDDACIVWDAATGEPLTIPVRINDALERVAFAPGNNSLLIHGRSNMFRLDLPIASLPLDGYKAPLPMTTLALDTR